MCLYLESGSRQSNYRLKTGTKIAVKILHHCLQFALNELLLNSCKIVIDGPLSKTTLLAIVLLGLALAAFVRPCSVSSIHLLLHEGTEKC